jgi:hypothetical protein
MTLGCVDFAENALFASFGIIRSTLRAHAQQGVKQSVLSVCLSVRLSTQKTPDLEI